MQQQKVRVENMGKEQAAVMELIWDLIRGKNENISKVDYFPQKVPFLPENSSKYFERATPESQGIPSHKIRELLEKMSQSKNLNMHTVMILRNGKIIGECAFYPYKKEIWHATYSLCKSITSMAIGFLIQENKLSLQDKVFDIFSSRLSLMGILRRKETTVEELLTMTSHAVFNETGAISGNDWIKGFMESPNHKMESGEFSYNSMNSYMLSAIVTEITGETMLEYLEPRLFLPLGITQVFWETCPKGVTKGGWGLFLCPEDAAKLGQLYLQKGIWEGKQILNEEWIRESTSKKAEVPEETGFTGYGYQIWMGKRPKSYVFNGMMGQNVFVYPDMNMVIVTTAGNQEFFQGCQLQEILEHVFPPSYIPYGEIQENLREWGKLKALSGQLESPMNKSSIREGGWPKNKYGNKRKHKICCCENKKKWKQMIIERLSGRTFHLEQQSAGLYPLVMQVFHNNYTDGIKTISFKKNGKDLKAVIQEGEEQIEIPLFFDRAGITEIAIHQESYLAAVEAEAASDEDGVPVLKVKISYLEDAMQRRMKFFFYDDNLVLQMDETPGRKMITEGLNSVAASVADNIIIRNLKGNSKTDLIKILMESTISPVIEMTEEGQ